MKKTLKIIFYIGLLVIVLGIASAVTVFIKYRNVEDANIKAEYLKTQVLPKSANVTIGETLKVVYTVKTPWDKKPIKLTVQPGKGSQEVSTPEFKKIKTGWGYYIWDITCNLQPYINGKVPEGEVNLIISPDIYGKMNALKLKVPKFFSKEIKVTKDELNLASSLTKRSQQEKSYTIYYVIAAIIVILLLLISYLIFVRKRKDKPIILTSWAEALLELNSLKEKVKEKVLNPERSISSLTDIVRRYLEARFEIHAPKQTTHEFLNDMESWNSPLNNRDRNFLREFMTTADMIKFARFDASQQQIIEAIARAEELVNETTPDTLGESKEVH